MVIRPTRREFLQAGAAAALGLAPGDLPALAQQDAPTDISLLPMPGRVTGSSALLHLTGSSGSALRARVRWGRDPDECRTAPQFSAPHEGGGAPLRVEAGLTGLESVKEVHYQVEVATASRGAWIPSGAAGIFRTQKPAGNPFRFCVMSDAHWGEEDNVPAASARRWMGEQIVAQMAADGPFDFCIDLGDSPQLTHLKSPGEAMSRYFTYRKIIAPLTRVMPVYLALGNHEREAGFFQRGAGLEGKISNYQSRSDYHQRWSTAARLSFIPNPRGDTYPEGGEGAAGFDTALEWMGERGAWNAGVWSQLGNFYAWSWGDALFVVLDPFRYTLVGSPVLPSSVQQWTLGNTQMKWLEKTLAESKARWKVICCHHLVGGGPINGIGDKLVDGDVDRAYARGSAIDAKNPLTEQAKIHTLMRRHGVQFFLYGHDHAFVHSVMDEVQYLCCGRSTHLNGWWTEQGMLDSYGDFLASRPQKEWIRAIRNVLGYTRFEVSPERFSVQWVKAGYSFVKDLSAPAEARRDWLEGECGQSYEVATPGQASFSAAPTDVDGVYTEAGARIIALRKPPEGKNYYSQPTPARPERYASREIQIPGFPERRAVIDAIPEVVYTFSVTA